MNYKLLEKELKKRTHLKYQWGIKQNNSFDAETKFIYSLMSFDEVLLHIDNKFKHKESYAFLKNYALNRWYNFWSAKAVESFFCEHNSVQPHTNRKHKTIDFYIQSLPFDHKTTVFPKGFKKSVPYAISHKRAVIEWLYKHQSKQQRFHLENRLFLVLVDFMQPENHWKLKAELSWLKKKVSTYLTTFETENLESFNFQNNIVKSDILWAIK